MDIDLRLISPTELQTESLHFKNRILDFFDVYARRQPQNPLILKHILPLLRLIQSSGPSEGDLANKAAGILRSRIGKAKEVPSAAETDFASHVLTSVHEMARKAASADFSILCSSCSLFVARTLDASEASTSATNVYKATLTDFFTRKQSAAHPTLVLDYISRFPVQAWPLQAELCEYISPGATVNAYRQMQAYAMLQAFSRQLGTIVKAVDPEQVEGFVRRVSRDLFDTLEAVAEGKSDWNSGRLKEMVKLGLDLARKSRSALSADTTVKMWDLQRLAEVRVKMQEGKRTKEMKSIHGMLKQLVAELGVKAETKKKGQKAKMVNGDVDGHGMTAARSGEANGTPLPNGGHQSIQKSRKKEKKSKRFKLDEAGSEVHPKVNGNEEGTIEAKKRKSEERGRKEEKKVSRDTADAKEGSRKKHKLSSKCS